MASVSHQGSVGVPGVPGRDGQVVSSLTFLALPLFMWLIKAAEGLFT